MHSVRSGPSLWYVIRTAIRGATSRTSSLGRRLRTWRSHGGSSGRLPADHRVVQYDHVHAGAQKAVQGLRRRLHDRLVLVEAGVENDRYTAELLELLDQPVV